MRARFFTKVGPLKGLSIEIGAEAEIGRAADCAIFLDSALISTRHARLAYDATSSAYWLEDLGSLNGTAVDGLRVSSRERLGHLHVITLAGKLDFVFQDLELCAAKGEAGGALEVADQTFMEKNLLPVPAGLQAESQPADGEVEKGFEDKESTFVDAAIVPVPSIFGSRNPALPSLPSAPLHNVHLRVLLASGEHAIHRLRPGENLVGRAPEATIRIDDPELSRRHATLILAGEQVRLRDEGSRNGSFVQGEQIAGEQPVPMGAGLRFGNREAWLFEPSEADGRTT
jgi:pSer/pThr/pTyr-binding forkhead associated (FHA) protein